ncbi:MAG: PRC-barrel domain-containing protein [Methanocellales archaeon]|nr:PRC-barrel domain-containing protein [Methanocellales archaeon]MDD3292180.1 PRC-barrel domain-containing protein [Methanocellales archaeon]MDD5235753.1 PRC-barrel domain-containing protein [Methanocellales archaeon]MDD5485818.1 PRC-barrel domain-containing protein [Methanocellales archaeon]
MKKEIMKERVHNYLRSRLFPWNFLMEPVDDETLEHFVKKDFMIPSVILDDLSKEELSNVICDEVKRISKEYLVNNNKLDPFAYAQAQVYTMLYDLRSREKLRGLGDIVDTKALARLMGISMDSFKKKEESILQLIHRYKDNKPSAKDIFGQKVIYIDGTLIGTVIDIVYEDKTGDLIELKVKTDKKLFEIPIEGVYLKNVYNNCVILKDIRVIPTDIE